MNYRGSVLSMSPTGDGGRRNEYICTAHYANHVEIVPTCPGTEGMAFPPIPLSGPGLVGVIYESHRDPAVVQRVRDRCASVICGLEEGHSLFSSLFTPSALKGTLRGVQQNLARLESLDGDQPATLDRPVPARDCHSALDRVFDQLFGGDFEAIGEVQDSIFVVPKKKETEMIGEHPNCVGKLVFIEIPLACDDGDGQSGEYIVVQQTADSLYGLRTTCCKAGLEVVRIPFALDDKKINVVDVYEDDNFVQEFIERLDDMDTEDFETIECDLAETASRQLSRMLEKKLTSRANEPMDRLFKSADKLFNMLGCTTSRMSSANPTFDQAEDRVHRTGCGQVKPRAECCGCGS